MTAWNYSIQFLPITRTYAGTIKAGMRGPRIEAFDTSREDLERVIRLAAAAPELLDELEAALPFLDTDHVSDEADCRACQRTKRVKALIAKTRGR
jgi:hypothetical protein